MSKYGTPEYTADCQRRARKLRDITAAQLRVDVCTLDLPAEIRERMHIAASYVDDGELGALRSVHDCAMMPQGESPISLSRGAWYWQAENTMWEVVHCPWCAAELKPLIPEIYRRRLKALEEEWQQLTTPDLEELCNDES